jgi:hypothetical protein
MKALAGDVSQVAPYRATSCPSKARCNLFEVIIVIGQDKDAINPVFYHARDRRRYMAERAKWLASIRFRLKSPTRCATMILLAHSDSRVYPRAAVWVPHRCPGCCPCIAGKF